MSTSDLKINSQHTLALTVGGRPDSLDPLDGDKSQNVKLMRMTYLTPIEIGQSDELVSHILESFYYERDVQQLNWKVKSGIQYSNGKEIKPEDVSLSIKRMLLARPDFPVIKWIKGKDKWLNTKHPLRESLEGIRVDGNNITISFSRDVDHPLYRFCLELFSIIPSQSIDLDTGHLINEAPPTSGHYRLASELDADSLIFKKNPQSELVGPLKINFDYVKPEDLPKYLSNSSSKTVVFSHEDFVDSSALKRLEDKNVVARYMESAGIKVALINPKIEPFDDPNCRYYFMGEFLKSVKKTSFKNQINRSIFTSIIPGYLDNDKLEKKLTDSEISSCKAKLKAVQLPWVYSPESTPKSIMEAMRLLVSQPEFNGIELQEVADKGKMYKAFIENQSFFSLGSTGFWALDPVGDIQMLFTLGLHAPLSNVAEDSKLQADLSALHDLRGQEKLAMLEQINKYISQTALFNVYAHNRNMYLFNKGSEVLNIPSSITMPSPWHLFAE